MQVESVPSRVRSIVAQSRRSGAVVGLVPTMGALHAGHISLIEAARSDCDLVVASIFVNPTQFGPDEDFEQYPRTLDDDLQRCTEAGTDLLFTPNSSQMYPPGAATVVRVSGLTDRLEGRRRPGHFDGVTTVVAALFNITVPDRAYFGQKDYQQQQVVRRMVMDLSWGIEIVTCPTVREPDGLAMSSRNRYLSAREREQSLVLYQTLQRAGRMADDAATTVGEIENEMAQMISSVSGVELDYAVVVDGDTLKSPAEDAESAVALVAASVGKTRLIDNHILRFC